MTLMTSKTKVLTLSALLISLVACVSLPTNENMLSDAQLISIAQQDSRKPVKGQPNLVIGVHKGTKVIEEFHCSDLCPENTVRIVHYDVSETATCDSVGGVTKSVLIPIAITVMPKKYCFPKVIADYWQSYP
ncbi:hypothetical protein [Psychrobacter sp. 72-O-c]|uniref:hypothetical protein n=1 Tax=Psychrobacter sp. 72-O-c TaxID=2774125 RepID=UPI001918A090|nr:hypothetical protein [Psychrobacter sp. 72-O-c]